MDVAGQVLYRSLDLYARATETVSTATATTSTTATPSSTADAKANRPGFYKVVGLILAICSGLFIGVSFVLKKAGLLRANKQYNEEAGEGYGYLKNWMWWSGMTLMILGEICNFVAYAFTDAILVTPLGALSVVVTTILSTIFLKERLSFVGWVACFLCIVGSVMIALNAPEQSAVADIQQMQHYVIAPGFLSYTGVIIVGCLCVIFFVAPKYGKKSMLVYLTICSTIGGLSVVATQGLGTAIIAQIGGKPQFNQWFIYVLLVFVIGTLLTEIIYLNKALNLFNAAMVTPTYYVYFTSSTIIASTILFQGLHGTTIQIIDIVMGFLVICSGVVLLQLAKSAKDVPDAKVFSGDLNQIRTVAEVEEPEYEPRADTIRGGAGIVRALSKVRTKRQVDEIKRIHDEMMEPIGENEVVEWDGLRRRKTVSTQGGGSISRRKTVHPPLGMTHFPDDISEPDSEVHPGFFGRIGRKTVPTERAERGVSPVPMENVSAGKRDSDAPHTLGLPLGLQRDGQAEYSDTEYKSQIMAPGGAHIHWNDGEDPARLGSRGSLAPPPSSHGPGSAGAGNTGGARRQFSFQNVFHRHRSDASDDSRRPVSRGAMSFASRGASREYPGGTGGAVSEEERLGLVHGDSKAPLPKFEEEEEWRKGSIAEMRSSPEAADTSGDLGRQRSMDRYDDDDSHDDDDDDFYNAPLRSPMSHTDTLGGYRRAGAGPSSN